MKYLPALMLMLALSGNAQTNLIPFWSGGGYARDDYQWPLHNTGQPDNLYSNGVWLSSEPGGDYDLHWRSIDCSGVKVGIIATMSVDGPFLEGIIFGGQGLFGIASNAVEDFHNDDFRFSTGASGDIIACVNNGDRVILLDWGEGVAAEDLSNACAYAASSNAVICAAAPDTGQNLDDQPDYPASWNFWNVLSITTATRTGQLYAFGIGASGSNVIGAPGRNVMSFDNTGTNIVYSTATSYAAPHAAGIVAELMAECPGKSSRQIVFEIKGSLRAAANLPGVLELPGLPSPPQNLFTR